MRSDRFSNGALTETQLSHQRLAEGLGLRTPSINNHRSLILLAGFSISEFVRADCKSGSASRLSKRPELKRLQPIAVFFLEGGGGGCGKPCCRWWPPPRARRNAERRFSLFQDFKPNFRDQTFCKISVYT